MITSSQTFGMFYMLIVRGILKAESFAIINYCKIYFCDWGIKENAFCGINFCDLGILCKKNAEVIFAIAMF